jgi:hypothetical protein
MYGRSGEHQDELYNDPQANNILITIAQLPRIIIKY